MLIIYLEFIAHTVGISRTGLVGRRAGNTLGFSIELVGDVGDGGWALLACLVL